MNRHQQHAIAYLVEENRVLLEQIGHRRTPARFDVEQDQLFRELERARLLVVELKQPATGQYVLLQEDATNAASEVYRLLFENALLRVFRMTIGPGQKTKMHWHPGGDFLFPLTTATMRAILPDGGSSTLRSLRSYQL